jgi:hypothetical protein
MKDHAWLHMDKFKCSNLSGEAEEINSCILIYRYKNAGIAGVFRALSPLFFPGTRKQYLRI